MKIAYNASAVLANNALNRNDNRLTASLERLSSGLKITHAKDNPSGLAMSKRMNAQIEGINQATQNAGDGVSIIGIADGAMSEIHDMLQRINELCVKASNGPMTDGDREMVNNEVSQLKKEIERIASETEFNGQKILDGSFDLRGYTNNQDVKVTYYSDDVIAGDYSLGGLSVAYDADGKITSASGTITRIITNPNGTTTTEPINIEKTTWDGNVITFTGAKNFELKISVPERTGGTFQPANPIAMSLEGFGAMDMQIGANEGQQLSIRIPKVSLANMGIAKIDLGTEEDARDALSKMGDAVKYVSSVRSRLGAYQNRLEHTISSLDISNENMTAAYSQIMDVDMAEEMTEYTTVQVMTQASTSMLAQANQRPSQVLQLLQ